MNAMEKLNPVCMRDRVDSLVDWLDVHTASYGRGLTRGQAEEALRWMRHEYERLTADAVTHTRTISELLRLLGLCEKCGLQPGCPDCKAVHDVPEGA